MVSEATAQSLNKFATVPPEAGAVIVTVGGVGGVLLPEPGRTSQMLKLYRSVVGAVSLMLTEVPLFCVGLLWIWTQ